MYNHTDLLAFAENNKYEKKFFKYRITNMQITHKTTMLFLSFSFYYLFFDKSNQLHVVIYTFYKLFRKIHRKH